MANVRNISVQASFLLYSPVNIQEDNLSNHLEYLTMGYKRCLMKRIKNIHPGEVLQEEFLAPLQITAYRLAKDIGIPQTRVAAIIKCERRVTADTALRLGIYFGMTPKFWLGLQDDFDVEEEKIAKEKEFQRIKRYAA